jgi:hypothetical protein
MIKVIHLNVNFCGQELLFEAWLSIADFWDYLTTLQKQISCLATML